MSLLAVGLPQQLADGGRSDPALRNAIKPALSLQSCVMLTNLRNYICVMLIYLRNICKSA